MPARRNCSRCGRGRTRPQKPPRTPRRPQARARASVTTAAVLRALRGAPKPSSVVPSYIIAPDSSSVLIRGNELPAPYRTALYRVVAEKLKREPDSSVELIFEQIGRTLVVELEEQWKCGECVYRASEGGRVLDMFDTFMSFGEFLEGL